jgi:hypothetical protein
MRRSCSSAPNRPIRNLSRRIGLKNRNHPLRKEACPAWGLRPQTPGIYRFRAKICRFHSALGGAAPAAPAISASESALGSHPCVALPSAQLNHLIDRQSPTLNPIPWQADSVTNPAGQTCHHSSRRYRVIHRPCGR